MLQQFLASVHSYPTAGADQLRHTIADHLHTQPEKIVIGNGSAELLRHILFYLLIANDTLLLPDPSWSYYHTLVDMLDAKVATFPLLDTGRAFFYDKFAIADQIDYQRPKAVLLCSPNNPTGSLLPAADFAWLIHHYPQVNFILDEAYFGFCDSYTAEDAAHLLKLTNRPNVFVIRTFSKFYALANLRLGFILCNEENGANLNKLAPVFDVPSISQALAAERLVDDQFEQEMKAEYAAVSRYLHPALSQLPSLTPHETCANFVLVKHDGRWAHAERKLFDLGFMAKRQPINGTTHYLRITLADLTTMHLLIAALHHIAEKSSIAHDTHSS